MALKKTNKWTVGQQVQRHQRWVISGRQIALPAPYHRAHTLQASQFSYFARSIYPDVRNIYKSTVWRLRDAGMWLSYPARRPSPPLITPHLYPAL